MTSTSSGGASVITLQFDLEPEPRRRRAGGAGGDQRGRQPCCPRDLPTPPIYSKVNPADAPILTLGAHLDDAAADRGRRTSPTRASRRRSRSCPASAWSASAAASGRRCACRSNPTRARRLRPRRSRTCAPRSRSANVNQAKGSFDGPRAAYTIDANDQLAVERASTSTLDRRLPQRRAGAPLATSPTWSTAPRTCSLAAWMNDDAGGHPEHPAPARRQRHRGGRPHQGAAAAAAGRRCPPSVEVTVLTDRTTTIRASVHDVQFELMLADRAGGAGDLPVPAQRCRPPSSRASRCRCRWSAPSA